MPDKVSITKSKLDSLANTVAAKTGEPLPMTIDEMKSAVANMSGGGGSTLVPKSITANGTYDPADDNADGYSEVTVNVPSGGVDVPVFDLLFDSNYDFISATCNKTWAECEDAYSSTGSDGAIARVYFQGNDEPYVTSLILVSIYQKSGESNRRIDYIGNFQAQPSYDIIYRPTGQIEYVTPSTYALELNATSNGTYSLATDEGVYTSVTVNVPSSAS